MSKSVQFVLPIPVAVSVEEKRLAASHAKKCADILFDWMPIVGRESATEDVDQMHWHDIACREAWEFFQFHKTPGAYSSVGTATANEAWFGLCRAMDAVAYHYGWREVDFIEVLPPFRIPHPAIEQKHIDRIRKAAAWIESTTADAAPDDDLWDEAVSDLTSCQAKIAIAIKGNRYGQTDDDLADFVKEDSENKRDAVSTQIGKINKAWKGVKRPFQIKRTGRNPVRNTVENKSD